MKILHTADLHLGKRVNEYPMLEDQRYILNRFLALVDEVRPDAVALAGDIYDKAQPSNEAVELFDWFLTELAKRKRPIFVISGNHDSPERIACMSEIVRIADVHLSPVYDGRIEPVTLEDERGPVSFYMLPFIKPAHVRHCFPDEEIASYTDAMRVAIDHMEVDPAARNVLITHQFVTGAERSDSEQITVGGTDNVDASVFDAFDYVALGHIHRPQSMGSDRIRYAGSPLKYSLSEANHAKSVTLAELGAKGELRITALPLTPLHDLREIKGTFAELMAERPVSGEKIEDYVYVVLTDEDPIPDAHRKLATLYTRVMKVDYDNSRTRQNAEIEELEAVEKIDPLDIFETLFMLQNNREMTDEQRELVAELLERIEEGEKR